MALTDTTGGTQTDPGTGKPSENPPAAPNKPTPPKEETPPGAPEKYAFTAPEGQELDTSALAQFEPVARELNLTQEQAQKLVDVYPKVLAGVQQQQAESWQKQTEDWTAAVKADKDIGGDKLASNLGAAQRAIDTFGTKELKEYLDGTAPDLWSMLHRDGSDSTRPPLPHQRLLLYGLRPVKTSGFAAA